MSDKKTLYTATEIVKRNPLIKSKWTAADIGYLFKMQIVKGEKRQRYNLINEDDVLRIFYISFPSFIHHLPVA